MPVSCGRELARPGPRDDRRRARARSRRLRAPARARRCPVGRGHRPGGRGERRGAAGIGSGDRAPERRPSNRHRRTRAPARAAQRVRDGLQARQRRRSVMQMEFPCSLKRTSSTRLADEEEAAAAGLLEVLGQERSRATGAGSKPGPSSVTSTRISVRAELGLDLHHLGAVLPVAGHDGVGQRLGERHPEVEPAACGRASCRRSSAGPAGPPPPRCSRRRWAPERHLHRRPGAGAGPGGAGRRAGARPAAAPSPGRSSRSARSAVSLMANRVSSLVSSNSERRSSLRPARRSSPPCSRTFLEIETSAPSPEESM